MNPSNPAKNKRTMKNRLKDNLLPLLLGRLGGAATLAAINHFLVAPSSASAAREASWGAFCAARGYDPADHSAPRIEEYLDSWCGSEEETSALNRLPALEI